MDLGLQGKRVLVTGSTRGIGLAIAHAFASEGAQVAITSRNDAETKAALPSLARLAGQKTNHLACRCDFTSTPDVEALRDQIGATWGGLDIIVANVGSGTSVPDPVPPEAHFDSVLDLNFRSAVTTSRVFLPMIEAAKGNILFIASIAGIEALGAPVDYSTSKSALIAFAKNVAAKVAAKGVRINCVAPGNILFPGGSWDKKRAKDPGNTERLIRESVPMQRFGSPEEIAPACLFLCSKAASFITGAVLVVDGGQIRRTI